MENDIEYIQSIVDAVNSWTTANPTHITNGTITHSKPDLRDVSTSDLLNEAFKRGAIEQFSYKSRVAKFQLEENLADFLEYFTKKFRHDALAASVDSIEKLGAFNIGRKDGQGSPGLEEVEFTIDYFVCKHPLTLKKESNGAYR